MDVSRIDGSVAIATAEPATHRHQNVAAGMLLLLANRWRCSRAQPRQSGGQLARQGQHRRSSHLQKGMVKADLAPAPLEVKPSPAPPLVQGFSPKKMDWWCPGPPGFRESFLAEHRGVKVSVPLLRAFWQAQELRKEDLGYGGAELHGSVRMMGKIKSQSSGRIPKGEPENYRTGDAKKDLGTGMAWGRSPGRL